MKTAKLKTSKGTISAKVIVPKGTTKAIIIANGAGANMNSDFISLFHKHMGEHCLSVKFNFLYHEMGKKSPDRMPLLLEAYQAVYDHIVSKYKIPGKNVTLSGKSMGGRVATHLAGEVACRGVIPLGYPLHAPGRPERKRDEHLYPLKTKILFIQGDRDSLCDLKLMRPVVKKLKNAKLMVIESGDHSLKVLKRSAVSQEQVFESCFSAMRKFIGKS